MSRGGDDIDDDDDVDDDDDDDDNDDDNDVDDGSNRRNLRCSICRGAAGEIQRFKS